MSKPVKFLPVVTPEMAIEEMARLIDDGKIERIVRDREQRLLLVQRLKAVLYMHRETTKDREEVIRKKRQRKVKTVAVKTTEIV